MMRGGLSWLNIIQILKQQAVRMMRGGLSWLKIIQILKQQAVRMMRGGLSWLRFISSQLLLVDNQLARETTRHSPMTSPAKEFRDQTVAVTCLAELTLDALTPLSAFILLQK